MKSSRELFVVDKPRYRPARYAEKVREELLLLVPNSIKDPRIKQVRSLTVLNVELSPDMKNGTCHFTLSEEDRSKSKLAESILNQASGYIRVMLMNTFQTKITPKIFFKYDKGYENVETVERLLAGLKSEQTKAL